MTHHFRAILGAAALVLCGTAPGFAGSSVIFTGSGKDVNQNAISASAEFDLSGTTLTVTLTNTTKPAATDPTDVLTTLFFDANHTLTPSSANTHGSTIYDPSNNLGSHTVGDGWQYKTGISEFGLNSGLSATGLGVFGPSGNFGSHPINLGGLDYGILPAGGKGTTNNIKAKDGPLWQNSLQFVLTVPAGFSLIELGDKVRFLYGTSLSDPSFTGQSVPEPSGLFMAAIGVAGLLGSRRFVVRRKR